MKFLIFFLLCSSFSYAKTNTRISNCPEGEHFVKAHFRRGYVTSSGKVVAPANVKAHCRVNPESYSFWQPKFTDKKIDNWPHKKEVFKNWSPDEIERVLEALSELPNSLWSEKIRGIYRASKSHDFPNPATSADGIIILYDTAFDPSRNLPRILAHELAHQSYWDLSQGDRKSYWYSLNWFPRNKQETIFISRKDGYIQDDGRESPWEDYANNVDSFLFEPEKLKRVTPYAYNWIKEHFGDKFTVRKGK